MILPFRDALHSPASSTGWSGAGLLHGRRGGVSLNEVTGILDGSEAAQGDGLYDLATPTLAHGEHLDDVIVDYGAEVDLDVTRAWWSFRSLVAIRWLAENGYGSPESFPEVAVLRSTP